MSRLGEYALQNAKSCEPEGPQDLTHRLSQTGDVLSARTNTTRVRRTSSRHVRVSRPVLPRRARHPVAVTAARAFELRSPEDLLVSAFEGSRVVMMNEAHDDQRRCVRTREIGCRLLPAAHELGVRHLAMEALWDRRFVERANVERRLPEAQGYLAQPEMRTLIQGVLDLGWTLLAYEADMTAAPHADLMRPEVTAWRELEQARNLHEVLPAEPTLVWCGWGHLSKCSPPGRQTMAQHFRELTGLEPFSLDQTITIGSQKQSESWLELFADQLAELGGTAGFLARNAPPGWRQEWADAFLLSLENELVDD
jgi:hypothetical protein